MLKKLKQIFENKGVTLVEVLIAASLFAVAVLVSGDILVGNVQIEKKTSLQNALSSELRIVLQQIAYEIQNGTIDYDEYYSDCVLQKNGCKLGVVPDFVYYGLFNGVYGSRFYDPGKSLKHNPTNNPDDLGAECSFPNPQGNKDCEVVYNLSIDLNTGQNPFTGNPDDADAFCDKQNAMRGVCDQIKGGSVTVDQLFILDKTGTKKTILAKKLIQKVTDGSPDDYALAKVVMNGKDYDQNGIVDIFSCADGYNCYSDAGQIASLSPFIKDADTDFVKKNKISIPQSVDLKTPFEGNAGTSTFVPITPLFASVKNVKFIIHPLEDPYKAYAEPNMKGQPSVTIVLTAGLSSVSKKDYPGDFPDITVQTTIAAGVTKRIDTYPPVTQINGINGGAVDKNWLLDMLQYQLLSLQKVQS